MTADDRFDLRGWALVFLARAFLRLSGWCHDIARRLAERAAR